MKEPIPYSQRIKQQDHPFYRQVKDGQLTSPSLIIQLKNGNQHAYGYAYLAKEMTFNPSEGIIMTFLDAAGAKTLHIKGRNLAPLWQLLTWHKITFIKELDEPIDNYPDEELVVTGVEIG